MKKLLNFVLIVSFLLFTALTLTSCDAFGKSGGFIGKIISSKEESQSDDTRQSDNSSNGKESPQGSVNDSVESSSEEESQSDNSSSEEESLQESANDSADSSSEEESQSEEMKEFFALTYNYNNGEQNGEISVEKSSSVKLQTPYWLGYTFKGWSINGNLKQSGEIITVVSDTTAYATWEIDKYQIVYNLNGGTLENAKSEFTINDLPLTFGYPDGETDDLSFVKWTTDEDGNNEISAIAKDASSLKDYTLYAFYENSADCLSYSRVCFIDSIAVFGVVGDSCDNRTCVLDNRYDLRQANEREKNEPCAIGYNYQRVFYTIHFRATVSVILIYIGLLRQKRLPHKKCDSRFFVLRYSLLSKA